MIKEIKEIIELEGNEKLSDKQNIEISKKEQSDTKDSIFNVKSDNKTNETKCDFSQNENLPDKSEMRDEEKIQRDNTPEMKDKDDSDSKIAQNRKSPDISESTDTENTVRLVEPVVEDTIVKNGDSKTPDLPSTPHSTSITPSSSQMSSISSSLPLSISHTSSICSPEVSTAFPTPSTPPSQMKTLSTNTTLLTANTNTYPSLPTVTLTTSEGLTPLKIPDDQAGVGLGPPSPKCLPGESSTGPNMLLSPMSPPSLAMLAAAALKGHQKDCELNKISKKHRLDKMKKGLKPTSVLVRP